MTTTTTTTTATHQTALYFVDGSLPDLAALLAGLPAGAQVHLLEPGADGMQLLAETLQGRTGIDAIHLLTHGAAGSVNLGSTTLTNANLESYSAQWATIQGALSADADLLIYGCDVAANDAGKALISQIADLSGADVAASTDLTGASALGGNWAFEFSVGRVQTPALEVVDYAATLADGQLPSSLANSPYSWGGHTFQTRINGTLSTSDPLNPARADCRWDRYTLSDIPNGATVKVYMGNSMFDDYLQIERNGSIIAQNDDAGDGERSYDAFVSWTYQAGDVIRATTYRAGETGAYSLWINTSQTITGAPTPPAPVDIGNTPPPPATAPTFTDSFGTLGTVADTDANDTSLANITGTLTAADTTPTGTLAFSGGGRQTYGTLNVSANGAFTFNPDEAAINTLAAGATASHTFNVTVSDGALSTSKNLTVNFTGANDLPTVNGNATMPGILEDAGAASATNAGATVASLFAGRFADVDAGSSFKGVLVTAVGDTTGQGTWNVSTDSGATWAPLAANTTLLAAHKLQFVPNANWNGTPAGLTVKAIDNNDGQSVDTATVSITVAAVNDAPTFTVTTPITGTVTDTAAYDTDWTGATTTGTLAATDIENDAVLFSIRGGTLDSGTNVWTAHGLYGTLTVHQATGAYTYTPTNTVGINALPAGKTALDSFAFKASDAGGAYTSRELTISITGANDTPVVKAGVNPIADQTFSGAGSWQFQIPADSFTDAEGAGLAYTVQVVDGGGALVGAGALPAWLTFTKSTRTFAGDPPEAWNNAGLHLKVTATDPVGASASDTFALALTNTGNQPPVVANPIGRHVVTGTAATSEVTFGAALGGQTLTFNNRTGDAADDTTVPLGSAVTGAGVAAAVVAAGDTNNYTVALKAGSADTVVFTAQALGDVTDSNYSNVVNGGTFGGANGGTATVTKVADGAATGTPESFTVTFAANGGEAKTITFDGITVTAPANATAVDVANLVAAQTGTYTHWTAAHSGAAVTFTQKTPGNVPDITLADFTGTFDTTGITLGAITQGTGKEVFEVIYGDGLGGSTLIFDGVPTTAGAPVLASGAATAFVAANNANASSSFTAAPKAGDSSTVVLTSKAGATPGAVVAGDFSGTYTGVGVGTHSAGGAWTYTVPNGVFTDPDTDALTYTAYSIAAGGAATQLDTTGPLQFNAATRTFSGDGSVSNTLIELRATDAGGSNTAVATRFQLFLDDGVDSDVSAGVAIPAQTWTGAGSKTFQIPADAFNFNDGTPDTLEYTAQLAGGGALPGWLTLNPSTGVFSGNPPADAPVSLSIAVTATEKEGGSAQSSVSQTFTLSIASPNDAPTVLAPMADVQVSEAGVVGINVGPVFADADGATSAITYSVTQADGSALPSWLTWGWNGTALTLDGNPPGNLPYLNLRVTGTDAGGATAQSSFTVYLQDPGASSSTGAQTANNAGAVTITGATAGAINEGQTLTASTPTDLDGEPSAAAVTYQWQVQVAGQWSDIAGTRGQGPTLTLGNDEAGKSVRVQAFYTDGGGVAEAPVSGAVTVNNVEVLGTATIAGGSGIGQVQTVTLVDDDGLVNVTPTYQWYRSDLNADSGYTAITGATQSTYVTTSADGDRFLKVVLEYTDNQTTAYTIAGGTVAGRTGAVIQRGQVPPVANDDTAAATEAGGQNNATAGVNPSGNLLTNDTDLNTGDTKAVLEVRLGADLGSGTAATESGNTFTLSGLYGTLTVDKVSGAYTYTVNQANAQVEALAPAGTPLTEAFNYTVIDSTSLTSSAKLTVTITGANDVPQMSFAPESSTVEEDLAGFVNTGILLADADLGAGANFALKLAVTAGRLVVVTPPSGITLKGDDTGTLTLTGNMNDINNWLQGDVIKYVAPPNVLGLNVATLTFSANDGSGFVPVATQTLNATNRNDAPILDLDADNSSVSSGNNFTTVFRPRGEAVAIVDGDISITDADADDTLVSGTVSISSGALDNEFGTIFEKLISSAGSSYTGSKGAITITGSGTASIALSGAGTHADYTALLKTITYSNSNPNAYSGDRTISISVTDAAGVNASASNLASFTTATANAGIAVGQKIYLGTVDTGQTVASVLDASHFVASGPLSGLTSSSALSFKTTAAVNAAVTSASSFVVETVNPSIKTGLAIFKNGTDTGLTVSGVSGATVTASGNITLATTDVLSFQTTASNNTPVQATTTVRVPWTSVVDMDGTTSAGRDYATTFTEDGAPLAIATSTASIDNQAINIKTFKVTLTNPLNGSSEELSISASMVQTLLAKGITVTVAADKHSITFQATNTTTGGTATDMQLGLRAIKYQNTDQNPSIVPRVISTYVLDVAEEVGVSATTTINIIPVNDAPVKGGDYVAGVNEGAVYVFTNADLNSTDHDNEPGTLKYVLTSAPAQGTLFRDTNNNGVVDDGEAIATVGVSTSVVAINAIGTDGYFTQAEVTAGTIKYAHNGDNPTGATAASPTGTTSFGFKVVDGMEDYPVAGVIPAAQDGTVTLTITEVDDAPTGTPLVTGNLQPGQVLTADVSGIADADGVGTFSYQWQVYNGTAWVSASGSGNTTASYTLDAGDSGKQVRVQVSHTDAFDHAATTLASNATGTVSFDNTGSAGSVTITNDGSPQAGETLTANTSAVTDPDGLGPFSYQWETSADNGANWTTVAGATGKNYTLPGNAATGAQYRAVVSYTDGRGNPENIDSTSVTVQAPTALSNQAPSLTGNGAFPATTALFSNVAVSTVESGQTIQTLTLQVSGLKDGAAEKLTVNGVAVDLVATTATTIAGGTVSGVSYAVSVAGAVATVTVTHAGLSEAQTKTLVEGLALSGGTSQGLRVVTLKSLQDSGGTTSSGVDLGLIGLSATVDVGNSLAATPSSNTAPTVTANTATVAEGALVTLTTANLAGTDAEQADGLKVVLDSTPTNGTLFRDANGNGKEDADEALVSGSQFALADVQAGRIKYLQDDSKETTTDSFTFNLSDGLASSSASTFNFTITPVDDAPTLTATTVGTSRAPVVFTQGTSTAIDLFSSPAASPVETSENITGVTLSISGLRDGTGEKLVVDGVEIALTDSTTGTTTTAGVGYAVSVTGGTATVTLTKDAAGTVWNGLLDGLKYGNTSPNPTNGTRAITLTSVTETGGEKSDVAITSYVGVTAVNGPPTLTLPGFTVLEGASKTLTTSDIAAADPDTPLTSLVYTLTSAPAHGTVYIDSNGDGKAQLSEILASSNTFTHAQLASGKVRYQHDDGESDDSFGVSVSDGAFSSAAATLTVARTPVNDAPTISGLGSDVLSYAANSGAKTLEQGADAVVTDLDSAHFNGGNLRVSISFNRDAAHDVLSIKNVGATAGLIGVSGTSVTFGGTSIGTFAGGSGTSDLVVTFNTAATPAAVSALINAIQFANDQAAPSHTSRTVSFALNDGQAGGQATPVAVNVNIATGATPSISIGNGFFIMENTQLVTALSATDPANRPLTFSISGTADAGLNPDAGQFEIVSGNLLRFKGAPDFEAPADAGANNVYNVIVRATNDQGSYAEQSLAITVLDQEPENGVAVGDTAGPVFGFATVNGNTLVMTYSDASHLSATNLPALSAFAVSGNTVTAVAVNATAKTVTLTLGTAVTAGQAVTVSYTDPTSGNDVAALQDAAGNDAASLVNASVSNITASTGGGGTGGGGTGGGGTGGGGTGGGGTGTGGTPAEGTVTGGTTTTTTGPGGGTTTTTTGTLGTVTVTETVTVTVNGQSTHELVYVPVPSGAGSTGSVVFPLLYEPAGGSDSKTTVSLPTGVGLVSVGDRTPTGTGKGLNLIELIQQTVPGSDPTLENMLSGGQSFLDGRSSSSTLWVNKVVLTTPTPLTQAPKAPVIINGAANNASSNYTGDKLEALVIDARALPAGTVLELQNVDFAVVLGDGISVRGGNGVNVVFGGDGSQDIFLGADNDILYGGAGDDIVGSAAGADLIFGNSGNDTIFGGLGSDILHGGSDNDVATYSGSMSRYEITRDHGKTIVRSLDRLDDIDTVINVETLRFDDATYTVQNELFHTQIATLYQQVLHRQADLGGFQYWAEKYTKGEPLGTIALDFLYSAEYSKTNSVSFDGLSQGAKIDLLYQHFLGREAEQAGHDYWVNQLATGMTIEDIAASFVGSKEMQSAYLGPQGWEFFI